MENLTIKTFRKSTKENLMRELSTKTIFENSNGLYVIENKEFDNLDEFVNGVFKNGIINNDDYIIREIALIYLFFVTAKKENNYIPFEVLKEKYNQLKKAPRGELEEAKDIAMANPDFKAIQVTLYKEIPDFELGDFLKAKKEEWKVEDKWI